MTVTESAKAFYEAELKSVLEAKHRNEFVAIEPNSKSYFVGPTFLAAALAAKEAFPEEVTFVIRIGHTAAFHLGAASL